VVLAHGTLLGVTSPPYGHDPYSLPPSPGDPAQPTYPAYGQPYGQPNPYDQQNPYGSQVVYGQPASVPPVSGLPQPYSPYAAGAAGYPAAVPVPVSYGFDPITGQPYSEKSKVVAGLLQLLLGGLLALGGVGRTYAGNTGLGVTQIVLSVIGWASFWCGFLLIVPWFISFGLWVWFVVDGIVMLAGRPVDGQGRLLRS
jgi:hypothetical protein